MRSLGALLLLANLCTAAESSNTIGNQSEASSITKYWPFKGWYYLFTIVAIAMIVGPFLLLVINKYAGPAWRRYQSSRCGEHNQNTRRLRMSETLKEQHRNRKGDKFLCKLRTEHHAPDYTLWFWHPPSLSLTPWERTKNKPNCHQPSRNWLKKMLSNDRGHDLEQGTVIPPPSIGSRSQDKPSFMPVSSKHQVHECYGNMELHSLIEHNPGSIAMSGALPVSSNATDMSTVRQRHTTERHPHVWIAGSDEIDRATHEQLLDDANDRKYMASVLHTGLLFQQHDNLRVAKLRRTESRQDMRTRLVPSKLTVARGQHGSQDPGCITQLSPLPSKLCPSRAPGLQAPQNSEETISVTSSDSNRIPGRRLRRKPCFVLDTRRQGSNPLLVEAANEPSIWLSSPLLVDQFKSCEATKDSAGIHESPATFWTSQRIPVVTPLDDLSTYEAEGSLDDAISQRNSSTSARTEMLELSRYRAFWGGRQLAPFTRYSSPEPQQRRLSLQNCMQTSDVPAQLTVPMARFRSATSSSLIHPTKRRQIVDRDIYVSLTRNSENAEEGSGVASSYAVAQAGDERNKSSIMFPIHSLPLQKHVLNTSLYDTGVYDVPIGRLLPRTCRKPQNEELDFTDSDRKVRHPDYHNNFLPVLQSSLTRLHYELSPGFRSTPIKAWNGHSAALTIWATNNSKINMSSRKQSQQHKHALTQRSTTSLQELAQKTRPTFDTSAWILRQPPDGIGLEAGAENFMYTGGLGRSKTLAQWQSKKSPRGLKRTSSEMAFPERSSKTLRRAANLIKVRLRRCKEDEWEPMGFAMTPNLDGAVSSASSDVSGSRVSGDLTEGSEDGW